MLPLKKDSFVISLSFYRRAYQSLSDGAGAVLIHGYKAPIIGRVCMDQTIVDVSGIPNVKAGDIATIIGASGNQAISAADIAEQAGSITNEILCRLGSRLERIVYY